MDAPSKRYRQPDCHKRTQDAGLNERDGRADHAEGSTDRQSGHEAER